MRENLHDNLNVALYNIFMFVRNNVRMEEGWYLYHASCSEIDGRTYMFLGHSGAGKTTLSAFLHYHPRVVTIAEDLCVVNYLDLEVESVNRPFFLRRSSYNLLTSCYGLKLPNSDEIVYNVDKKIVVQKNHIESLKRYKIDQIFLLNLCKDGLKKNEINDKLELVKYSYIATDIFKGVQSAISLCKSVPMHELRYYDLNEVYSFLLNMNDQSKVKNSNTGSERIIE